MPYVNIFVCRVVQNSLKKNKKIARAALMTCLCVRTLV